jgi:hypothetical protein
MISRTFRIAEAALAITTSMDAGITIAGKVPARFRERAALGWVSFVRG